jgi:F0F1-type ATP synthase epsilon subunit
MVMNILSSYPWQSNLFNNSWWIVLPGLTGQVGVLDGHAALITALDTGFTHKLNENGPLLFYVVG